MSDKKSNGTMQKLKNEFREVLLVTTDSDLTVG